MANEEQLSILKQGVNAWNNLRRNIQGLFDISHADLSGANLQEADLGVTNLSYTQLSHANLRYTNLFGANLTGADLTATDLTAADLTRAKLGHANLRGANLEEALLRSTDILESKWDYATVGLNTVLADLDFSETRGLESVIHRGPSSISSNSFVLSKGKIPQAFLRGCGLSDWEIEVVKLHNPDLTNEERNRILYKIYDLQVSQAVQISPLFISYSHADGAFVEKIEKRLQAKGIRFWRDVHDMKSGRIEKQIDRAIRQNPTVLLALSEHSLSSDWVEHEVRTARELEKEMGRDVLCPVALDDSWKSSKWPKRIMEQIMEYNILDFSAWEDAVKFEKQFRKLIEGLDLFYKG